MKKLIAIPLITAALALTAIAIAGPPTTALKVGDMAHLAGTDIHCAVGRAKGQVAVDCFRLTSKGAPVRKTYSVGLTVKGVAVLQHVNAKGKISIVRKLQSAARKPKLLTLGTSGSFKVAGTDLGCFADAGTAMVCFRYDVHGPLPKSYGVIVTDKYAALMHFNAKRKSKAVLTKVQGH